MDVPYLIITFEEFEKNIENLIEEARTIEDESVVRSEQDLATFENNVEFWLNKCDDLLKKSFNKEENEFRSSFKQHRYQYKIPKVKRDFIQEEKLLKNTLNEKISTLRYLINLIKVCDLCMEPNKIEINSRKNLTIKEKEFFLLHKLYDLYSSDLYFGVKAILTGNGIDLKRYNEYRDIAEALENYGYINVIPAHDDVSAKITSEGAKFIEEGIKKDDKTNGYVSPNFEIEEDLCFVLIPFEDKFSALYDDIIKKEIEEFNIKCIKANEIFRPNIIMDDVIEHIKKANFLIADLTDRNPNVFYELGLAHAFKKNVILISQNIDDNPFDVKHFRCISYQDNAKGIKILKESLKETIKEILNK